MATIKTAMILQDNVTPVLRSMRGAMNATIGSFEALQTASAGGLDVGAIQSAKEEMGEVGDIVGGIEQQILWATEAQRGLNREFETGHSNANGLLKRIVQIGSVIGISMSVEKVLGLSDGVVQTTARLDLMNDNLQSTAELEEMIFQSAQRSRGAYLATADAVAKMGMQAGNAFQSTAEIVAFTEQLNKTFVISGTTVEGVSSAMLQLTQAMASGKLQGEELNAILDNAQPIVQNIADYLAVPVGSIKEMAAQGLITSDVIKNAMFAAAEETNAAFAKMPVTFDQITTSLTNQALQAFQPILWQINMAINSEAFQAVVSSIAGLFAPVAGILGQVLTLAIMVATAIIENWSCILPVIFGVTAAFVAYHGVSLMVTAALAAQAAARAFAAFQTIAHEAALNRNMGATFVAIAEQWGLNAALYACPITWIVLGFMLLVAVLYTVVAVINKVTGSTLSATGIICGVVMTGLAFIGNLLVALANFVLGSVAVIWNYLATFAEFIANVFSDPVGSVVRLFAGMADVVLGILENLASAVDTIFGSNLADVVGGWRSSLQGMTDELVGEAQIEVKRLDTGDVLYDRFDYSQAYDTGNKAGTGFINKIKPTGNKTPPDTFDYSAMMDGSGMAGNISDISDNTGAIKDSLEITEEDLKYMRDLAERDVINRFTTADLKVEMNTQASINSNLDLDGVVSYLENGVYEAMYMAAEGVHQ